MMFSKLLKKCFTEIKVLSFSDCFFGRIVKYEVDKLIVLSVLYSWLSTQNMAVIPKKRD